MARGQSEDVLRASFSGKSVETACPRTRIPSAKPESNASKNFEGLSVEPPCSHHRGCSDRRTSASVLTHANRLIISKGQAMRHPRERELRLSAERDLSADRTAHTVWGAASRRYLYPGFKPCGAGFYWINRHAPRLQRWLPTACFATLARGRREICYGCGETRQSVTMARMAETFSFLRCSLSRGATPASSAITPAAVGSFAMPPRRDRRFSYDKAGIFRPSFNRDEWVRCC
jgi:hypothetical protein